MCDSCVGGVGLALSGLKIRGVPPCLTGVCDLRPHGYAAAILLQQYIRVHVSALATSEHFTMLFFSFSSHHHLRISDVLLYINHCRELHSKN